MNDYITYNSYPKIKLSIDEISEIRYGIDTYNIDITDIAFVKCRFGNNIVICQGDHKRASLFGDPLINILKNIYIKMKNSNTNSNTNSNIEEMILDKDFNIELYKKFNTYIKFNTDIDYYNHYKHIALQSNNRYFEYIHHGEDVEVIIKIRTISNYIQLFNYNSKFIKPYFIYNKQSFYTYYNDFDYEYYRNKYFLDNNNISEIDILLYYHLEGKKQKHLINNKIKIIFYVPNYYYNCGGIVAIYNLAKIINELNTNYYCKVFSINNKKTENIYCKDYANIDEINDNTIVIYPEIITGNPLNAKHVIRWILLNLGIEMPINHYHKWNNTDIIYFWEPNNNKNNYIKILRCHYVNTLFKRENINIRNDTCYIIKKGRLIHKNINNIHPHNSINIEILNNNDIKNIFNTSKYFYCYDPKCMYIVYALKCGCIPIIYPVHGKSREEYFRNSIFYDKTDNIIYSKGIAYGNSIEELTYAENTLEEGIKELDSIFNKELETVNLFLNDMQTYLNNPNDESISYLPKVFI